MFGQNHKYKVGDVLVVNGDENTQAPAGVRKGDVCIVDGILSDMELDYSVQFFRKELSTLNSWGPFMGEFELEEPSPQAKILYGKKEN